MNGECWRFAEKVIEMWRWIPKSPPMGTCVLTDIIWETDDHPREQTNNVAKYRLRSAKGSGGDEIQIASSSRRFRRMAGYYCRWPTRHLPPRLRAEHIHEKVVFSSSRLRFEPERQSTMSITRLFTLRVAGCPAETTIFHLLAQSLLTSTSHSTDEKRALMAWGHHSKS